MALTMSQSSLLELSHSTQFELHPMPCTFTFECHPNFRYITRETNRQSMQSLGITDGASQTKFEQSRMGMLASLLIPRGEDDHKMILASKNLVGVFAVDDVFESHPHRARHFIETLIDDAHNPAPDAAKRFQTYPRPWLFFRETTEQLRNEMPPSLFSRYASTYAKSLLALLDEVEDHQAKNRIPDPETYRSLRRKTIFVDGPILLASEFCMGIALEREVFESPDYVDLCNFLSDHLALVNDLASFRKEFYDGIHFNWVCVLMKQGKSLQEAVNVIYEMIHELEARILELQKRLIKKARATGNMDLLKFANACPLVASGNVRWSFITGRYHGYNNPLISGEPFHGTCLLHPKATIVLQLNHCHYTHPLLVAK